MSHESMDRPERVSQILGEYLEKSGLKETVERAGVVDEWEDRVGEAIAKVTRPRGVQRSALVVEVRSSAWLMELNLMKKEILSRLNEGRAEALIEKIVFVLGEDPTE